MKQSYRILFAALIVVSSFAALGRSQEVAKVFTADQASEHVGEFATVCGTVASAKYVSSAKSAPTFLNLDKPYPKHIFTIVIWGTDRRKFEQAPDQEFRDKRICVTGTITEYKGKPEIVVRNPSQIHVSN